MGGPLVKAGGYLAAAALLLWGVKNPDNASAAVGSAATAGLGVVTTVVDALGNQIGTGNTAPASSTTHGSQVQPQKRPKPSGGG
jgi:hypothetical protein